MNKFCRSSLIGVLCTTAMLVTGICQATTVLTFEGVGDQAAVNDFYNGGTDSAGNSGPNYGINFSSTSLGLIRKLPRQADTSEVELPATC